MAVRREEEEYLSLSYKEERVLIPQLSQNTQLWNFNISFNEKI